MFGLRRPSVAHRTGALADDVGQLIERLKGGLHILVAPSPKVCHILAHPFRIVDLGLESSAYLGHLTLRQ